MESKRGCDYKSGRLRSCSPLAVSVVPMQQDSQPQYDAMEGLTRGTLFPGLDLPFKNVVNTRNPAEGTPLGELMALGFAVDELRLYMDTHPDDEDAFQTLKDLIALTKEAHKRYTAKCGPIAFEDVIRSEAYDWIDGPWPWTYPGKEGGKNV